MNILIGLILFVMCVGIGVMVKTKYLTRYKNFIQLNNLIRYIKTEIEFKKTTLEKLIIKLKFKFDENKNLIALIENFENYVKKDEPLKKPNFLKDDEWEIIKNYFENLGKSGQKNQLELCDQTENYFANFEANAKDENLKKGSSSFKLWICVGALLFIMFI